MFSEARGAVAADDNDEDVTLHTVTAPQHNTYTFLLVSQIRVSNGRLKSVFGSVFIHLIVS